MKKNKKESREQQAPLGESLEKRLALYAMAAGAAGVGVLALAPAAHASDITLVTTPISIGVNSNEYLSINSNPELSFADVRFTAGSNIIGGRLEINGLNGAEFDVSVLAKGATVGSGDHFTGLSFLARNHFSSFSGLRFSGASGSWANKTGYLGFKFISHSKSYFGWAHLMVTANAKSGETGYISEFGYDTVAGQSIRAGDTGQTTTAVPEPGTLSLLALGALGLLALRKKKHVAAERESVANS